MKSWEIIADRLSKAGWSWGWVSAVDSQGRTIWIVDAPPRLSRHRSDRCRCTSCSRGYWPRLHCL